MPKLKPAGGHFYPNVAQVTGQSGLGVIVDEVTAGGVSFRQRAALDLTAAFVSAGAGSTKVDDDAVDAAINLADSLIAKLHASTLDAPALARRLRALADEYPLDSTYTAPADPAQQSLPYRTRIALLAAADAFDGLATT